MKLFFVFLGIVFASAFSTNIAFAAQEWGVDRPGSDYKNFNLATDSPAACEARCNQENQCKAWTFVRPGVQGPSARCWLKTAVPSKRNDNCCVSGVKQVSTGSFEPNTNRPGSDYKSFFLGSANPVICRQACASESQCRAWTFVKPGIQGAQAKCWLKNAVPLAQANNCCASGVK